MTDDEEDHREGEAGFELESASAPSALHLLPPPSRDSTLAAAQADPATLTDPATSTSHDSIASRLMQEFARRFTGSLCDDLDELSHAETEVESKSGEIIVKPEWSIRMRATELKLAYLIGRPIQRQQVLQAQVQPGYEDLVAEARRSPAFRSTLRDLLREIEAQPGGDEGVAGME